MGKASKTYVPSLNEFTATIVEKIGKQTYSSKSYKNPLAVLKGEFLDNASDVEEIYVSRAEAVGQDKEGLDTLKRIKPDIQTLYHKQNYGDCYTVTVTDQQVRRAFTSNGGVKKLADEILSQLQTGYNYDEYVAMRSNLADLESMSGAKKISITDITDLATAKAFVKQLKKDIGKMKFRNKQYCEYETNTTLDEMLLFVTPDLLAEIDVELLATAFNMSKTDLEGRIIEVDEFPTATTRAILCDRGAIRVHPTLYNLETQRNAKGMFTNYHLNVEYIISTSPMYNVAVYSTTA